MYRLEGRLEMVALFSNPQHRNHHDDFHDATFTHGLYPHRTSKHIQVSVCGDTDRGCSENLFLAEGTDRGEKRSQ